MSKYPFWPYLARHRGKYAVGLVSLIAVDLINVGLPLVIREAIDALAPRDMHRLMVAGFSYLGLMILQAVGRYLWRIYLIGTSHFVAQELRLSLYRHLQRLPLSYYQSVRTGDLMSRATNDIESIRMAVGPGILVIIDAVAMFLMIVPVMVWLSWKLSLLAFAFYPIVPFLTARLGNRIDLLFEELQIKMSQMSAYAQESFAGIRLIKSLVLESRVHQRFRNLSQKYLEQGILQAKYQASFSPTLGFLTNLGTFLILLLGGMDVMSGLITVGTFVAFQRFVVQLSWPMEAIGWAVTMNREGFAAERRLQDVLSTAEVVSLRTQPPTTSGVSPVLLEIKDLHFQHPGQSQRPFHLELSELSLVSGSKVGLVGPVGAGKTTLFQLLLRLYEPEAQSIFFNGVDVTAIRLESLRRQIASVEQQIFLFSESIHVNVALGSLREISPEEVRVATTLACVDEEIAELDGGWEALLGERGVNLSGGQKQRLALARALVREPSLLLLDDAFSAVDVAVEHRIIENFFNSYPDLSVCFASHRLSIMPRMDEVWLLDGGQLVGRGTHAELLRTSDLYQGLWEKSERRLEIERFEHSAPLDGEAV